MRIRKRQVPLPLSSLCPVPLSDPLLHDLNYSPPPSMVQLHDPTQQPNPSHPVEKTAHVGHPRHPQPSDRPNQRPSTIQADGAGCFSDASGEKHKQDCGLELLILKGEEDEKGSRDGEESDDIIRKEMILGAETLAAFASGTSSSSHQGVGRWFEGEKAFPLKKRRGNFERGENNTIMDGDHHQKDKKLMKAKITNKKGATQQQQNDGDGEAKQGLGDHDHANIVNSKASAMRKRARGSGAIMEGSRCSRVNGRGWRCCQQTLVGYSLCEHHLGKGRLRSMSNVRSRSTATTTTTTSTTSTETEIKRLSASSRSFSDSKRKEDAKAVVLLDDDRLDHENYEGDEVEEKPLVVTKKRMKLGIVKARSMSSLLGQTNTNSSAIAPVLLAPSDDDDNI